MRGRAPHSRNTLKKVLANVSRNAFSVSCQTRSATRASTSCRRTMPRIRATVSGATRNPSGAKRAANRILDEGGRHVPQDPRFNIASAAVGIDQRPVGRLRDGIDGEVTAPQILL